MIAEVQKMGGIAGFIDAEHALDPVYAKNIGVDIDNLYISQPDNGEQALESLRSAWDMSLACRPTWLSPMSPSISDLGTSAATESTTTMSMAPERTKEKRN